MLYKTRGIVLNYIKYRDTSIIAKVFTADFGIQSYILNGVRSSKSKGKIAFFQPLTRLELVVYHKKKVEINRIAEIKCPQPFTSIPFNIKKSSMALFMTEILIKTIKTYSEGHHDLFEFLDQSIQDLDKSVERYENFHVQWLLKLSSHLGFGPSDAAEVFNQLGYLSSKHLDEIHSLDYLLANNKVEKSPISNLIRQKLLDTILQFYSIHVENFGGLRSLPVLREVMQH